MRRGVSLYPAIELIASDVGSKKLQKPLQVLLDSLREGEAFSTTLHEKAGVSLYIANMIHVGENEGSLLTSLEKAAKLLNDQIDWNRKLQNALAYPITLVVLGTMVLLWILLNILPNFQMIYDQAGIVLPLPTRILFAIQHALVTWGWKMALLLVIIAIGLYILYRPQLNTWWAKWQFKVPLFGTFRYYYMMMNLLSTLGSLHGSGLTVIRSLQLTHEGVTNPYIKQLIERVMRDLIEGQRLSVAFSRTEFFPPLVIRMMMAGEESAELHSILIQLTDYMGDELDMQLKRFLAIIGPVSVIIMGVFVLFIALAFLLPLFRMTGVLHHANL